MKQLKMWFARNFQVISLDTARTWYLTWIRNIYGDEVNRLGYESIFEDDKGRIYRVDRDYDCKSRTEIDESGKKVKVFSDGFRIPLKQQ